MTTPSRDRRRTVGALGERLAEEHLTRRGYRVLERNYRTRFGELDLVAADGRSIVFCEVKARVGTARGDPGGPLASIGASKRRRVRSMAREWLAGSDGGPRAVAGADVLRFDAIGITLAPDGTLVSLEHLNDAF
ncbi:MAG TPA: YraN family protein [Thermoleophilaceae bacterium]|nr:YraN family protein [Thermoleophilaceae bacterium]